MFEALSARAPPRYTAFGLPEYRFVPGARPHPVADPRGHSYGRSPRYPPAPLDDRRWRESPGYLYGCDLYNRGFWWEAHEAWEALWHLAGRGSAVRAALQGLIQLANSHLKLYMGRPNAASRLGQSFGMHLDRAVELAGPHFLGLDLPRLRAAADDYVAGVLERADPGHDPESYPYLDLVVEDDDHTSG